jgi:hypothetical protein
MFAHWKRMIHFILAIVVLSSCAAAPLATIEFTPGARYGSPVG